MQLSLTVFTEAAYNVAEIETCNYRGLNFLNRRSTYSQTTNTQIRHVNKTWQAIKKLI